MKRWMWIGAGVLVVITLAVWWYRTQGNDDLGVTTGMKSDKIKGTNTGKETQPA